MEYLMTYGWALLIIAVVLAALYYLGVFSTIGITGTSCVTSSGFLCTQPTLTTSGALTFNFGQSTGATLYNLELGCAATPSVTSVTFNSITAAGVVQVATTTGNTFANGQSATVSGLPCYGGNLNPIGIQSIGASYTGYIWISYTTSSSAESASNPWLYAKVATLKTPVI